MNNEIDVKLFSSITILYVEDENSIREQSVMFFDKIFKKAYSAADGLEALEIFKEHHQDIEIIVTDLNMPKMDGIELIAQINSIDNSKPVVVTTAHTDSHYIKDAMQLDVDKYIPKPIVFKDLTNTIVSLVSKYRKRASLETLAKELASKDSKNTDQNNQLQFALDIKTKELEYYKTIVDNFVITFETDKVGTIVECSNKFCNHFGYNKGEIIGKSINYLKCETDQNRSVQQNMLDSIHNKKTICSQYKVKNKEGHTFTVDTTMTPKYGSDSLVSGYYFYMDLLLE